MRGPGIDITGLLNGFGLPPMPVNSRQPAPPPQPPKQDDQISDIVSVSGSDIGDTKDISIAAGKRRKRKNEVTL
jgi:hypothetical protein